MEQTFNPLNWLAIMLIAHTIGIFAAFYVYDDGRKRYASKFWVIGWAIGVYLAFIIVFWFYLLSRPPATFFDAPELSRRKKLLIYFVSFPLGMGLIAFLSLVFS